MSANPAARRRQNGYLLLPVVLMLVFVAAAAYMLTLQGGVGIESAAQARDARQAQLVARAGLAHARFEANAGNCTGYSLPSKPFGAHSYTASFTPASQSPVDITATATLANGLTRSITRKQVKVFEGAAAQLFQQPAVAGKDTFLDDSQTGRNYGSDDIIKVGKTQDWRGLLEFDVSGLPQAAIVRSATLELYVDWGWSGNLAIHRVLEGWTEGTCEGGGGCTSDGATWLESSPSVPWSVPGGAHDPQESASISVTSTNAWASADVSSLVSAWHQGVPNYGMVLKSTAWEIAFASGENSDPTLAPKLTIEYSCECAPASSGGQVVLQPGPGTGKDVYMSGGQQAKNYGAHEQVFVDDGVPYNALLQFDLAGLPSNAIVTDAQLELFVTGFDALTDGETGVHRVTTDWVEGTGGSSGITPADGANWTTYDGLTPWITPGGDFDPNVVDSVVMTDIAPQWYQWNVTSLVSDWKQGVQPNYGLMLRQIGGTMTKLHAETSDSPTETERPKLTISYICPCGAPCSPPLAVGNDLLMVVANPASLTTQEITKQALIENWGFTVSLFDETEAQSAFDAAYAVNDVVFVSNDVSTPGLGGKLAPSPIGIVIEKPGLSSDVGLGGSGTWSSGTALDIVNDVHYISSPFALGNLPVLSAAEPLARITLLPSADLVSLGEIFGNPSLAALDQGGETWDLAGGADSRRVLLPWGDANSDVNNLTDNGRTAFKRSLEWAATPPSAPGGYLDRFTLRSCDPVVDWVGSNGDLDWSGSPWIANDGGNPCGGEAQLKLRTGSYRLDLKGVADISRAVDLSSFGVGTLRFRYATTGTFDPTRYLQIWMSGDNGGSWTALGRIDADSGAEMMEASYGITALLSANSVIRFQAINFGPNELIAIDEVAVVEEFTAGGDCASTYLDSQNDFGYAQTNGTLAWGSDWLEINESDGPGLGDERSASISGSYVLEISDNDGGGEGLERAADLSSAGAATLTFQYRRDKFDDDADFVSIDVSIDDGLNWETLGTIGGAGTDAAFVEATFPFLAAHLTANARIRFLTSPGLGDRDKLRIDEIKICLQ